MNEVEVSCPPRNKESARSRFAYCAALLHHHGLLTDSEYGRVKGRASTWQLVARRGAKKPEPTVAEELNEALS